MTVRSLEDKYHFVLGSKSPRRKELLEQMELKFTIRSTDADETIPKDVPTLEAPEYLSKIKGLALLDTLQENELIITADTLVILNDQILGKPLSEQEAFDMIKTLSGKVHQVITGVSLFTKMKEHSFHETTSVEFHSLSDEDIQHYVKSYQPMDKAGSYGIQEWIGLVGVKKIEGCFFNVMGLPIPRLYSELKQEF